MKRSLFLVPCCLLPSCVVYSSDLLESSSGDGSGGQAPVVTGGTGAQLPSGGAGNDAAPGTGAVSAAGGAPGSGATGAGGSASGGTPGTGGAPTPIDCALHNDEQIVANFETGEAIMFPAQGRSGNWFLFNDATGTQTPLKPASGPFTASAGGACESHYSLRTTGTDFLKWGAGVGVDLVPKAGNARVGHDLSEYSGFSFQARAESPTTIRVSWADKNTASEGGVCDPAAGSGEENRCGDYFGAEVIATSDWQSHSFQFSALSQRGFGLLIPGGLDRSAVYSFRAQVGASATFDYSIDEIVLLP